MWGMAAAVGLGACGGQAERPADTAAEDTRAKTVSVNIKIQCLTPDSLFIQVSPWKAELKKNNRDTLIFVVDSATNADSVVVALKTDTSSWPLADRPPYSVGKGQGAKRGLRGNEPGGKATYPYNITATCTVGSTQRKLVIDPDIFVD